MAIPNFARQTYEERAKNHPIPVARELLETIARKQSNLAVSVDVTTKAAFLRVVQAVGPYCCLIKTHIDIISDFDQDLTEQLTRLSKEQNFLIFEDRKFADIGNTVKLQYSAGTFRIASWAHIVNAHALPGDGIVEGLASIGKPLNRGLLLLAEMSSAGALDGGEYRLKVVEMAKRHTDFVFGFIAQSRVQDFIPSGTGKEDFLILSPGVGLDSKGDGVGQQYRTPEEVIYSSGCDVAIVGRGIYGGGEGKSTEEIVKEAKRYQSAAWAAYLKRLKG